MAMQYIIVDPIACGGAVHPVTLTGSPASKERHVVRDGRTTIGTLRRVCNGSYKGRRVFAWQSFDLAGKLLVSQTYEIRDEWSGRIIGTRAVGVSEKEAVEAVIDAAAPSYA